MLLERNRYLTVYQTAGYGPDFLTTPNLRRFFCSPTHHFPASLAHSLLPTGVCSSGDFPLTCCSQMCVGLARCCHSSPSNCHSTEASETLLPRDSPDLPQSTVFISSLALALFFHMSCSCAFGHLCSRL